MVMKSAFQFNNNSVAIQFLKEGAHQIHLFDLPEKSASSNKLKFSTELKMPEPGSISDLSARYNGTDLSFRFGSFLNPGSMFAYDVTKHKDGKIKEVYQHPIMDEKINLKDFKTELVHYKSKDGTEIPMFIVRKKKLLPTLDSKPKKPIPTFIYVYGGFGEP